MNDKLYIKIKLTLLKFDFDKPASFTNLYQYSKQISHGQTFKRFVKICQNMGVQSTVKRFDDGLKRVLIYDKSLDKYTKGEITVLASCEVCSGSGVVEKVPEITE